MSADPAPTARTLGARIRRGCAWGALTAALLVALGAYAVTSPELRTQIGWLARQAVTRILFSGPVARMWDDFCIVVDAQEEGVAYAGTGNFLGVFDIRVPARPRRIGAINLHGLVHGIVRVDDVLYVAAGAGGLLSLDVSDPRAPRTIDRLATDYALDLVAVGDSLLYLAAERGGIWIVDRSNPRRMRRVAVIEGGYVNQVAVSGTLALAADGERGLVAFDISEPRAPRRLGALDLTDPAPPRPIDPAPTGVAIMDPAGEADSPRVAFLANGRRGLTVVDVSDPTEMRILAETPVAAPAARRAYGYADHVTLDGNRVYVTDLVSGISIFDVTDPRAPLRLANLDTGGQPGALDRLGEIGFLADGAKGFTTVDLSEATNPRVLGGFRVPARVLDLAVGTSSDGAARLYAARGAGGVDIWDASEPAELRLLRTIATRGFARRVLPIDHGLLAVADVIGGTAIVDPEAAPETDPTRAVFDFEEHPWDLAVSDGLLYAAVANHGLTVYDISTPEHPTFVTTLSQVDGYRVATALAPPVLYQADLADGLHVFDVRDPRAPRAALRGGRANLVALALAPPRLYAIDGLFGLRVFDVSEPLQPTLVARHRGAGRVNGVTADGARVYLATESSGVVVLDASPELEAPAELRRLATDGPIYDVLPYRGWLFVAASERGILAAPAERDPPGWRRYRCDGGAAS